MKTNNDTGLVFLTGGSALSKLAESMAQKGLAATHLVAVMDDGGSTGELRRHLEKQKTFGDQAISIGDIRNRMSSLASPGPLRAYFDMRFRNDKPSDQILGEIRSIINMNPQHLITNNVDTATQFQSFLSSVLDQLSKDFNYQNACLGNLALYGGYLTEQCNWFSCIEWFHEHLNVCGTVLPISQHSRYLAARLSNRTYLIGEHAFDQQYAPFAIEELYLCRRPMTSAIVCPAPIALAARHALETAAGIVYSWGSLYSSILALLLIDGVKELLQACNGPKILLLNPVKDSETLTYNAMDFVRTICQYANHKNALTHLIALRIAGEGSERAVYSGTDRTAIEQMGIHVIEFESPSPPSEHVNNAILETLIELTKPANATKTGA